MRRLGNKLLSEQRFEYNIIFTHSHIDHIVGFPFFKPIYNKDTTIHFMGCPNTQGNIKLLLSKAMSAPFFPLPFEHLKATFNYADACSTSFHVDSVEIFPINLSHTNGGLGYKFVEDGKKFVFLTDNELGFRHRNGRSFEDYAEFARGADLLFHDAQYTPEQYKMAKSWGHSAYSDALNLALTAHVKRLGLFHHNQDRHDGDQDAIVEACREIIESKKSHMECFALTQTTELTL
jgi:ribonuclease BN (tRNA processing enzyme)